MPEPTIIFVALSAAFAAFVLFASGRTRARQAHLAAEAVAQERRHLARELHDGLAQELAFISMQARQLARGGDQTLGPVADAAERALDESRQLITTLRSPAGELLGSTLADVAERLAERHGATLSLEVDPEFRPDPETGGHLLRILGEAMSNSLVHGRARAVTVRLSDGGTRLRVADDGIGFEPDADRSGEHFGITSMRARAREIGGDLLLRSHPGAGTVVEVVFP